MPTSRWRTASPPASSTRSSTTSSTSTTSTTAAALGVAAPRERCVRGALERRLHGRRVRGALGRRLHEDRVRGRRTPLERAGHERPNTRGCELRRAHQADRRRRRQHIYRMKVIRSTRRTISRRWTRDERAGFERTAPMALSDNASCTRLSLKPGGVSDEWQFNEWQCIDRERSFGHGETVFTARRAEGECLTLQLFRFDSIDCHLHSHVRRS